MDDLWERFQKFLFSNFWIAALLMPFVLGLAGLLAILNGIKAIFDFFVYCFKSNKK